MKLHRGIDRAAALAAAGFLAACSPAPQPAKQDLKAAPPAKLEGTATREADLPTITVAASADLGIRLEEAKATAGTAVRRFVGEVVVQPGRGLTVSNPLAGVVEAPPGGAPVAGSAVAKDQTVFLVNTIAPLLRSDARADGEADMVQARSRMELARQRKALVDRMRTEDGVLLQARARLDTARQRKALVDRMRTEDGSLLQARTRLEAARQRKVLADRMRADDGALLEARARLDTARQRKARADKALVDDVGTARAQEEAEQEVVAATKALATVEIQLARTQEEAQHEVNIAQSGVDSAEVQLKRAQEEAQYDVAVAMSGVEAAEIQLTRSQEEAQQDLTAAASQLQALEARLRRLESGSSDGTVVIPVRAPFRGILRQVFAGPGQTVAAGAPVFEIVDLNALWLRVPIYAGEAATVAAGGVATAQSLSGGPTWTLNPVRNAPPSADPLASTIDFYYSLPNDDLRFRPGEKLTVSLPGAASRQWIAAPWSSVVFDTSGGTWIYEKTGDNRYSRRRVDLDHAADGKAYLNSGLKPGSLVVADGAAELWGFEFGTGK